MDYSEIKGFINTEGKLTQIPAKRKKLLIAVYWMFEHIEKDKVYSEREINDLIKEWHTFGDPATFRREMFDLFLINRDEKGMNYTVNPEYLSLEQILDKYSK